MKLQNKLEIQETLQVGLLPNASTSNFSVLFEVGGLFHKRVVGSIINRSETDYLPYVSNSFPNIFNVNASTTNANPNLVVSFVNQLAGTVFAAPQSFNGTPTFRMLQDSDLSQTTLGNKQVQLVNGLHTILNTNKIDVAFDNDIWVKDKLGRDFIYLGSTGANQNDTSFKRGVLGGNFKWLDADNSNLMQLGAGGILRITANAGSGNRLAMFDLAGSLFDTNIDADDIATETWVDLNFARKIGNYQGMTVGNSTKWDGLSYLGATGGNIDYIMTYDIFQAAYRPSTISETQIALGIDLINSTLANKANVNGSNIPIGMYWANLISGNSRLWDGQIFNDNTSIVNPFYFMVRNSGTYDWHRVGIPQVQTLLGIDIINNQLGSFAFRDSSNLQSIPQWQVNLGINLKANQSGYYSGLSVGQADNAINWGGIPYIDINNTNPVYFITGQGNGQWNYTHIGSVASALNPYFNTAWNLQQVTDNGNTHRKALTKGWNFTEGDTPNILRDLEGYTSGIARPIFATKGTTEEWGLHIFANGGNVSTYFFALADGTGTGIQFNRNGTGVFNNIEIGSIGPYQAISSPTDIGLLDLSHQYAQRLLTGGILASDIYSDNTLIPSNGIYSKGTIATLNHYTSVEWASAYDQVQNIANSYVHRTGNVSEGIDGIKSFTGSYTTWNFNGDDVNNALGFNQTNSGGFLSGTLNNFDYILYRNSQQKVFIQDTKVQFTNLVQAPQFVAENGGLVINSQGGVNANTTKIFFNNATASIGWAISQGINNVSQEGLSFGTWDGATYTNTLFFDNTGNIYTSLFGSADLWYQSYLWGDHKLYNDNGSQQYLGGNYIGGGSEKPNYFGSGKLKLQMLSGTNIGQGAETWNDVLWISAYEGSDVKGSTAIISSKHSDKISFTKQDFDSNTWGVLHDFWHTGNLPVSVVNTIINFNPSLYALHDGTNLTNISNWQTTLGVGLWGGYRLDGGSPVTPTHSTLYDASTGHFKTATLFEFSSWLGLSSYALATDVYTKVAVDNLLSFKANVDGTNLTNIPNWKNILNTGEWSAYNGSTVATAPNYALVFDNNTQSWMPIGNVGFKTFLDLSAYALVSQVPTNNNQLTNGAGYITSANLAGYALISQIPTNNNQLTNGAGYITASSLPTVNNGALTMSVGAGLTGSATFTANQAGASSFAVAIASGYILPTTTQWNSKQDVLTAGTNISIVGNVISATGSGGGGIVSLSTDDPNQPGPSASNVPITFNSHVAYGRLPTDIVDEVPGNMEIIVETGDVLRFYGSYDNTFIDTPQSGTTYDIDIDGIRKHIYNIIFQGIGGGTVMFGRGLYSGDQINITVSRGQQINLQPQGTNIISSFGQEVQTHANLIWLDKEDTWVLVGYD